MTDIQSSQRPLLDHMGALNRSATNVSAGEGASNNLYTYIGLSEPDRDKGHVYENQSIVNAQNKSKTEFDPKRHEAM